MQGGCPGGGVRDVLGTGDPGNEGPWEWRDAGNGMDGGPGRSRGDLGGFPGGSRGNSQGFPVPVPAVLPRSRSRLPNCASGICPATDDVTDVAGCHWLIGGAEAEPRGGSSAGSGGAPGAPGGGSGTPRHRDPPELPIPGHGDPRQPLLWHRELPTPPSMNIRPPVHPEPPLSSHRGPPGTSSLLSWDPLNLPIASHGTPCSPQRVPLRQTPNPVAALAVPNLEGTLSPPGAQWWRTEPSHTSRRGIRSFNSC